MTAPNTGSLLVDFAGELHQVEPTRVFTIGRGGDLAIEDNPYLHRIFVEIRHTNSLWWVANVGNRVAAHLTDDRRILRTTLSPGASIPLVFARTFLTFAAGTTSYEVELTGSGAVYEVAPHRIEGGGETTIGNVAFTESQLLAVLALAEPLLRRVGTGAAEVPASNQAAHRLGWAQTRFNRKLDNVCDKLTTAGVRGLRGDSGTSAANRRLRLAEYAVSTLLVSPRDLPLLDSAATHAP